VCRIGCGSSLLFNVSFADLEDKEVETEEISYENYNTMIAHENLSTKLLLYPNKVPFLKSNNVCIIVLSFRLTKPLMDMFVNSMNRK